MAQPAPPRATLQPFVRPPPPRASLPFELEKLINYDGPKVKTEDSPSSSTPGKTKPLKKAQPTKILKENILCSGVQKTTDEEIPRKVASSSTPGKTKPLKKAQPTEIMKESVVCSEVSTTSDEKTPRKVAHTIEILEESVVCSGVSTTSDEEIPRKAASSSTPGKIKPLKKAQPAEILKESVVYSGVSTTSEEEIPRKAAHTIEISEVKPTSVFSRVKQAAEIQEAVFKGDWKMAKSIIEKDRNLLKEPISVYSRTAHHVAACEGNWEFIELLMNLMDPKDIEMQDDLGCTALHYAAVGGSIEACRALVRKNSDLAQTISDRGWTPLLTAAHCAPKDKDVIYYLSSVTTDEPPDCPFTGPLAGMLAYALTAGGFHDIILCLLEKHPSLATAKDADGLNILDALLSRPQDFQRGKSPRSWTNWIYSFVPVEIDYSAPWSARIGVVHTTGQVTLLGWPRKLLWSCIELLAPGIKRVRDAKLTHKSALKLVKRVFVEFSKLNDSESSASLLSKTIIVAASSGIVEIVKTCLEMKPDIIWLWPGLQTLLKVAVIYRQEKILNLMRSMVVYNKFTSAALTDERNNSILHLTAKLAPPAYLRTVSGVALQMQREVRWFKEVEKLVHPFLKGMSNKRGKTAQDIFSKEHKALLENAEKWMKDTSNSCMVVAALISTIMFAAAFTVPGGNSESTGIPFFLKVKLFMVFAISDALGLIFSSTSLLVFLSIQTARNEEDLLELLPKKLIIGLASLLLSITNMMISFAATFSIVIRERSKSIVIAVPFLASLPVTIYPIQQLPLFVQVYQSTYGSGTFEELRCSTCCIFKLM